MKTKVIKWMNLFLVLAVLFGYQWIVLGNQKKRDDYKQMKMENETLLNESLVFRGRRYRSRTARSTSMGSF